MSRKCSGPKARFARTAESWFAPANQRNLSATNRCVISGQRDSRQRAQSVLSPGVSCIDLTDRDFMRAASLVERGLGANNQRLLAGENSVSFEWSGTAHPPAGRCSAADHRDQSAERIRNT
jgi:hypothetical protein